MAKGRSGRVVIEIDPELKRALYGALAVDDSTLKDWFVDKATEYLSEQATLQNKKAIRK